MQARVLYSVTRDNVHSFPARAVILMFEPRARRRKGAFFSRVFHRPERKKISEFKAFGGERFRLANICRPSSATIIIRTADAPRMAASLLGSCRIGFALLFIRKRNS